MISYDVGKHCVVVVGIIFVVFGFVVAVAVVHSWC